MENNIYMGVQLYNSMGRSLQEFEPIKKGKTGLYACGPTVYNYAHIGNLRAYVFEDILRRTLETSGLKVTHVMNVTDVGHLTDDGDEGEDKMVKSARESGMTVWDIAQHFTDAFFRDTRRLNIKRPTVVCRATEHIDEMIALVQRLEERGFTYEAGGNIYFDTSRFPDYGKMALLDRQELNHGARVAVDSNKKNPQDFVLWFTKSKFENQAMMWDSPWGRGYPGWHLECSAMSMKYLGEHFDIHCGGIDHIPVHHTNEIAQSEAATGKTWVNYWLHNEFLLMKKGKMSKSKGGFLTLERLEEEGYHPLDYRYFLLGGHYRSQLVFSWESLDSAQTARANLMGRIARLKASLGETASAQIIKKSRRALKGSSRGESLPLGETAEVYRKEFLAVMEDDLNTPRALSVLWRALKEGAFKADAAGDDSPLSGGPAELLTLLIFFDQILALDMADVPAERDTPPSEDLPEDLAELVRLRQEARKNRDFQKADEYRDALLDRGIRLVDTPEGVRWERV